MNIFSWLPLGFFLTIFQVNINFYRLGAVGILANSQDTSEFKVLEICGNISTYMFAGAGADSSIVNDSRVDDLKVDDLIADDLAAPASDLRPFDETTYHVRTLPKSQNYFMKSVEIGHITGLDVNQSHSESFNRITVSNEDRGCIGFTLNIDDIQLFDEQPDLNQLITEDCLFFNGTDQDYGLVDGACSDHGDDVDIMFMVNDSELHQHFSHIWHHVIESTLRCVHLSGQEHVDFKYLQKICLSRDFKYLGDTCPGILSIFSSGFIIRSSFADDHTKYTQNVYFPLQIIYPITCHTDFITGLMVASSTKCSQIPSIESLGHAGTLLPTITATDTRTTKLTTRISPIVTQNVSDDTVVNSTINDTAIPANISHVINSFVDVDSFFELNLLKTLFGSKKKQIIVIYANESLSLPAGLKIDLTINYIMHEPPFQIAAYFGRILLQIIFCLIICYKWSNKYNGNGSNVIANNGNPNNIVVGNNGIGNNAGVRNIIVDVIGNNSIAAGILMGHYDVIIGNNIGIGNVVDIVNNDNGNNIVGIIVGNNVVGNHNAGNNIIAVGNGNIVVGNNGNNGNRNNVVGNNEMGNANVNFLDHIPQLLYLFLNFGLPNSANNVIMLAIVLNKNQTDLLHGRYIENIESPVVVIEDQTIVTKPENIPSYYNNSIKSDFPGANDFNIDD